MENLESQAAQGTGLTAAVAREVVAVRGLALALELALALDLGVEPAALLLLKRQ